MMSLIKYEIRTKSHVGETVAFIFDFDKFAIIRPIVDSFSIKDEDYKVEFYIKYPGNNLNKNEFSLFHKKLVFGKILSYSRIDEYPIIEFDLDQISKNRNLKIESILP